MILDTGNILLIGSILLFISVIAGKAGYKFGVPALLLFLGVGMIFGSDGLGIQFHNPHEAQFIGVIALSIILFSGGMDTKFTEIKPIAGPGRNFSDNRRIDHHNHYRRFYLLHLRIHTELSESDPNGINAACCRYVLYRLSFGLFYFTLQRIRTQTKITTGIRIRERK